MDQFQEGRPQQERLRESVLARVQARLDSMPVIEQAKGVLMAQQGAGPTRCSTCCAWASQRANVKVSVLAAQIIGQFTSSGTARQR